MAGQRKTNKIEYVFQGNTLDLQQAIKKVNSLLASSTRELKSLQDGALTAVQTGQIKSARALVKSMNAALQNVSGLTEEQKKQITIAGKEALKQAESLDKQAKKQRDLSQQRAAKEQAAAKLAEQKAAANAQKLLLKEQEAEAKRVAEIERLTSVAGQENAKQHAAYLEDYANKLKHTLSNDAYSEIIGSVDDYRAALMRTDLTQEQLAEITQRLQTTYRNYAETLQAATRAQTAAARGVQSLSSFVRQAAVQVQTTVKSFSFWIQILSELARYIKQGMTDASAYIESLNFLNVTIGETNEKFREFLDLQQKAFALDPTELNETAATFYSFGNAIGWTSEQINVAASGLTMLAADLSSLRNTDLTEMTTALRSAIAGNTKPLMRFGIAVHDASVEEWLLSKGIDKSMNSMNEASQAFARYLFILDKTKTAQGDLARTIETPANQARILGNQLKLLFQNIGGFLLVVAAPAMRILNYVLQPINTMLSAFTALSTQSITGSVGEGTDALEDMADASDEAARGLASFDELNVLSDSSSADTTGVSEDLAAMLESYDNMAKVNNPFVDVAESIGDKLAPTLELARSLFEGFVNVVQSSAPLLTAVTTPINTAATAVSFLAQTLNNLLFGWQSSDAAMRAWSITGLTAISVLGALAVAHKAYAYAVSLGNGSLREGIKFLIEWIALQLKEQALALKNIALKIKDAIVTKAQALAQWWHNASLASKLMLVSAGLAVGVIAAAGIAAAVMTAQGDQAESEVQVPAMANGGVVQGATLAMVGEGRYPEAVVPLGNSSQFTTMKEDIASAVAARVGTGNIKVYVQIGAKDFENYTYKVVSEANRRNTGASLQKVSSIALGGKQ